MNGCVPNPCNPCDPCCITPYPWVQGWTPTVNCARPTQRLSSYDPNAAPPAWTPGSAPWTAAGQPGSLLGQPPLWAQALYAQYFGAGQGPTIFPLS